MTKICQISPWANRINYFFLKFPEHSAANCFTPFSPPGFYLTSPSLQRRTPLWNHDDTPYCGGWLMRWSGRSHVGMVIPLPRLPLSLTVKPQSRFRDKRHLVLLIMEAIQVRQSPSLPTGKGLTNRNIGRTGGKKWSGHYVPRMKST